MFYLRDCMYTYTFKVLKEKTAWELIEKSQERDYNVQRKSTVDTIHVYSCNL